MNLAPFIGQLKEGRDLEMGNQLQPAGLEHGALSQCRGRGNEKKVLATRHTGQVQEAK